LGFAPGFAYLGDVPEQLATPRLTTPRRSVPAGSVGIAGRQTGVYPISTPGGWRLLGRTPVAMFRPEKAEMSLLRIGDRVRFVPISPEKFAKLKLENA
jgi:inhibitor of KinA